MRLLDLFCCEGGAATGYHRAGFEVVGVDLVSQPKYPFEFHQADALDFCKEHGHEFDAIHASPPCQRFCAGHVPDRQRHPDLIQATRDALNATGKPYVIENVPNAPIRADIVLTGQQFGLPLIRKRHFETNWFDYEFSAPQTHFGDTICVVGTGTPTGTLKKLGRALTIAEKREAMEMPWASVHGLSQAIPPAYTQWIGTRLMEVL